MPEPLLVFFVGGPAGLWKVERLLSVKGATLPSVDRIAVYERSLPSSGPTDWVLRGIAGHERYVERREHDRLAAVQPPLSRPEATRAALIPIKKSEAWWSHVNSGYYKRSSAYRCISNPSKIFVSLLLSSNPSFFSPDKSKHATLGSGERGFT